MAVNDKRLKVTELDFDDIKDNLDDKHIDELFKETDTEKKGGSINIFDDDSEAYLIIAIDNRWVQLFTGKSHKTYTTIDNLEVISTSR